jgi:hypothetical protein
MDLSHSAAVPSFEASVRVEEMAVVREGDGFRVSALIMPAPPESPALAARKPLAISERAESSSKTRRRRYVGRSAPGALEPLPGTRDATGKKKNVSEAQLTAAQQAFREVGGTMTGVQLQRKLDIGSGTCTHLTRAARKEGWLRLVGTPMKCRACKEIRPAEGPCPHCQSEAPPIKSNTLLFSLTDVPYQPFPNANGNGND